MSFEVLRDPARYLGHRLRRELRSRLPRNQRRRRALRQAYAPFVGRGSLCFDIGAHVGDITSALLDLGAHVISVEPQRWCVEQLHRSFDGDPRVTIIPAAVSDRPGTVSLAICDEATTISTLSAAFRTKGRFAHLHEWSRVEDVPAVTLDELVTTHGEPSLCKIDVEGHDAVVIRGLHRALPLLTFEFHKELADDVANATEHLTSLGQYEFNFALGESRELALSAWIDRHELGSRISSYEDPLAWGDVYARIMR